MTAAGFSVFVVDDDESVDNSLRLLIESHGYSVVTFKSAEDFLEHGITEEDPRCLILDIHLPGMNGYQLQEHLIRARSRIPVIFITGHDCARMEDKAIELGAVAYLRKPFDDQDLLGAIQKACEKMTTKAG